MPVFRPECPVPGQTQQAELVPAFSPVSNQIPELYPPGESQGLLSGVSALRLGSGTFCPNTLTQLLQSVTARGTGRSSLGNVASCKSLTAGPDPDCYPAPGPGGDKGSGALSLCLGVPALAKLLLLSRKALSSPTSVRPFRARHVPDGARREAAGTHSDRSLEEGLGRGLLTKAWQVGDLEGGMMPGLVTGAGWSPTGLVGMPGSGHWIWRQRVPWF